MPAGINQLDKLDTLEVSLVPKGANKKRFALRKGDKAMEEIIKAVIETDLENEAQLDKVLKAGNYSEKAVSAFKAMYKLASGFKDEMPKGMMKTLADLAGYDMPAGEVKKGDQPDFAAMPPEVRTQVEALWKSNKEAAEKNEKLEATIKAERDERTTKEFITKAATEYAALPGLKAEELGKVLKAMHDNAPDQAKAIEALLKGAAEAIKQGELLRQAGHPNTGLTGGAWNEIENLADTMVQKADKPLTKADAIDAVLKTEAGKGLYQKYLGEHPSQTGRRA